MGLTVLVVTGLLSWRHLWASPAKTRSHDLRLAFAPEEALELRGGDEALLRELASEAPPSAELAATLERRALVEEPLIFRTLEGELRRLDRALATEGAARG